MRPQCFDRPPRSPGHWRHGLDSEGRPLAVFVHNRFKDFCAVWSGTNIGSTPETTRYPQHHGYSCQGCKWLPEEFK